MATPNEALTFSNVAYTALGAGFAAFSGLAANWLLRRWEYRRRHEYSTNAEEIKYRQSLWSASQELIATLERRVKDSEQDRAKLWSQFHGMQEALADCERLHGEDARKIAAGEIKIAALERQNAIQAEQIRLLQASRA